jgi:hypothetical protein
LECLARTLSRCVCDNNLQRNNCPQRPTESPCY